MNFCLFPRQIQVTDDLDLKLANYIHFWLLPLKPEKGQINAIASCF